MANQRARTLRKKMSDGERKLWHRLRANQVEGLRFRRQHPIGSYIVDFVCLEKRLIVEVDGGHHAQPEQIEHDRRRDHWLSAEGYRVMRIPSIDVFQNIDGVIDGIWAKLQEMPSARPEGHPHRARRMS
jgi:very-short-patch-repair endonuclease